MRLPAFWSAWHEISPRIQPDFFEDDGRTDIQDEPLEAWRLRHGLTIPPDVAAQVTEWIQ